MKSCVRAIQASTGPSTLEALVASPGTVNIHSRHIRVSIFETVSDCLNHETTSVVSINWLLCQLVNGSARVPMKDVPSCEKPTGAAWKRRT